MTRKGRLEEIFSKALYSDDATLYSVSYRDFESIIEGIATRISEAIRKFYIDTHEQNLACQEKWASPIPKIRILMFWNPPSGNNSFVSPIAVAYRQMETSLSAVTVALILASASISCCKP